MYKNPKLKTRLLALCLSLVFGSTPLTALAANSGGAEYDIDFGSGTPTKTYVGIYQPVSGTATGGKVYIDSGFNGFVIGGWTKDGDATGNSVYITGGTVGSVCGGRAGGTATGNSVYISGNSTVTGVVYGGQVLSGQAMPQATVCT